jgi:hypothetical protein
VCAPPGAAGAAKPIFTGPGGTITPQELAAREWTHTFEHPGLWGITARVRLAGSKRELASAELVLRVSGVFDERRLEYAGDPARNLLREAGAVARASSSASGAEAALALDSSYASSWRCAASDRAPSISISLERPVQAGRLLLAHARPSAAGAREPRAISVEVVVNRTQRYPLELDPDVLEKSVLALPSAPVRELEIRVTSAEPGLGAGELGFSEIELLR